MIAKIYGYQNNSGRISKYQCSLVGSYDGGCAIETEVEIPDYLEPYFTILDEICIIDKGEVYNINHVLCVIDSKPALLLPISDKTIRLKILSEKWVDRAMCL